MGVSVREAVKGSGEWYIFIRHNGKRTSKKIGDKSTALQVAEKIKAKILLGEYDTDKTKDNNNSPTPPFKTIAQEWLENHVKHLSDATQTRYKGL